MRRIRLIVVALVVLVAAGLAGCAFDAGRPPETPPAEPTATVEQPGSEVDDLPPPALVELAGGRVRAIGVLTRVDLEGGFWAVVDAPAGAKLTGNEPVVAVILLPEAGLHGANLDALVGTYVQFEGTLSEGASIRMAGPEVMVESFKMLGEP